jgi:diketogulonate reductase-like aldo/keto reductase
MGGSEKALLGGAYALQCGIHHIDSAQIYGTEKEAGEAIKKAGLHRDEVYVTTKCTYMWPD